jgi:hypothetical protein
MGRRQTETFLDARAVYSEAACLHSVLLWLQGYSGPLGGVPKSSNNYAAPGRMDTLRHDIMDMPAFLPARNSYE